MMYHNHQQSTLKTWLEPCMESIKECAQKPSSQNLGVMHNPLIDIPIDNVSFNTENYIIIQVVIDELHLLLRITDVLLRNLIWAVLSQEQSHVPPASSSAVIPANLQALIGIVVSHSV